MMHRVEQVIGQPMLLDPLDSIHDILGGYQIVLSDHLTFLHTPITEALASEANPLAEFVGNGDPDTPNSKGTYLV